MALKYGDSAADEIEQQIGRRKFMAGAGAAAMSFTIIRPALVRGTEANSKIRLGIIGCGMRGKWIADIFAKHGGQHCRVLQQCYQCPVCQPNGGAECAKQSGLDTRSHWFLQEA